MLEKFLRATLQEEVGVTSLLLNSNDVVVAHKMTQLLAQKTLEAVENIKVYDLRAVANVFRPGLRSLSFAYCLDATKKRRMREQIVRSVLTKQSLRSSIVSAPGNGRELVPLITPVIGEGTFKLSNVIYLLYAQAMKPLQTRLLCIYKKFCPKRTRMDYNWRME